MRRINGVVAFAVTLVLTCSDALADWVTVYVDETMTYYADPTTRVKSGNKVTMRDLTDYREATTLEGIGPFLSMQTYSEFDCSQESARWIYASFHPESMGGGEWYDTPLIANDDDRLKPVTPGSFDVVRLRFACLQLRSLVM